MEVRDLERPDRPVETVVGVAPRSVGGPAPTVGARDREPDGHRGAESVGHRDPKSSSRPKVPALRRDDGLDGSPRNRHHAERDVAVFVRDERDASAVRRPARPSVIALAVGQLEGAARLGRRQPELVALAPEVRAVDHAPAVAGPVRPRLPIRLLLAHQPHRSARPRLHPPEVARAPDVAAVGNQDELLAVGRPGGREVLVELRVVIARELAVHVFRDSSPLAAGPPARNRQHEHVEPSLEGGRDVSDPRAVRRPPRVQIDGSVGDECAGGPVGKIQDPQLQRVVAVGRIEDLFSVRRPVGLRVVTRSVGQLHRFVRAEFLPPQRALHRIHELRSVRRPRLRARSARDLREVHLPVVIGVRLVDLLQDRLALPEGLGGEAGEQESERHETRFLRDHAAHFPMWGRGKSTCIVCRPITARAMDPAG